MRSVTVRLDDLRTMILNLGFVGENEHRKFNFDCKKMFGEYPSASVSLTVQPPAGDCYPATVERNGDLVSWTVTDSDLIEEGCGEIQLTFMVGEVVAKTCIGRTKVERSLGATGDIPTPIENWIEQAEEVISEAEAATAAAEGAAEHQPIIDDNGYWAVWDADAEEYVATEYKAQGTDGHDGVGIVSIEKTGTSGLVDTYTITFTSGNPVTYTVTNGRDADPAELIDDNAGAGDTDKVWSADKSHELLTEITNAKTDLNALEGNIGDDWNESTQTVTPSSSATAGYAYFSPVAVGSSIKLSTNAGHSYFTYNNLTPGKTYHFKTYANTTFGDHIVFANSSNKVTGFAIGQQSSAGSVEADITVPENTVLTYVTCNKGTADTETSIAVTIHDIVPLTTDVKNIRESFVDVETNVQNMTTATAGDVDKALSPKTVANGKVIEWQFKNLGGGSNTEERYESVQPVANSAANGRTNATVGSTVAFGTQTDWYHVKFSAESGSYRGTYFSSNSTKYNNIVAVDANEKVLAILNDTPSGSGIITKTFNAPTNTAAIYLCCYGDIGRVSTSLMLEKAVAMTDGERLDNVEKQITSATANITKSAVAAYMENVSYTDGDYSTSAVGGYINNPKKIYREDIPNPVVVRWNPVDDAVSITVTIEKTNKPDYGRDISYEAEPTASSLAIYNLVPNTTYYYQVTAILSTGVSAILSKGIVTTANSIVRMMNIEGIVNVRDIGGKTATGGTVKYGMIYRGSELDGVGFPSSEALGSGTGASILTDNGKLEMLNHVGIRAELDLRAGTYTKSAIAPTIDFACVGFPFYENVLAGDGLTALKTAFDFIVSEVSQNRPVYMHCSGGNDRTGTLVTCLLGLLGVSENDLSKEYELSSFTFGQSRSRNSTSYNYKGLMAGVLALSGNTLADKFETLFTSAGATSANITAFRTVMTVI